MTIPRIPLGDFVEEAVYWTNDHLGFYLDAFSDILGYLLLIMKNGLLLIPEPLFILLIAAIAYLVSNKDWKLSIGSAVGFILILSMDLWELSIETLALVIASAGMALVIGIPIGILCGKNDHILHIVKPILDLMQTMPSFVYLIPAVIFLVSETYQE